MKIVILFFSFLIIATSVNAIDIHNLSYEEKADFCLFKNYTIAKCIQEWEIVQIKNCTNTTNEIIKEVNVTDWKIIYINKTIKEQCNETFTYLKEKHRHLEEMEKIKHDNLCEETEPCEECEECIDCDQNTMTTAECDLLISKELSDRQPVQSENSRWEPQETEIPWYFPFLLALIGVVLLGVAYKKWGGKLKGKEDVPPEMNFVPVMNQNKGDGNHEIKKSGSQSVHRTEQGNVPQNPNNDKVETQGSGGFKEEDPEFINTGSSRS